VAFFTLSNDCSWGKAFNLDHIQTRFCPDLAPLLEFFWLHMMKQSQSKLEEVFFDGMGIKSGNKPEMKQAHGNHEMPWACLYSLYVQMY
jgi:hypothetical protein